MAINSIEALTENLHEWFSDPWRAGLSSTKRCSGEPGGAEQHPLHLFHISAREFNPMSQAVQVQKKLLRLALAARSPAASVLSPVAGALVCAQGIGAH